MTRVIKVRFVLPIVLSINLTAVAEQTVKKTTTTTTATDTNGPRINNNDVVVHNDNKKADTTPLSKSPKEICKGLSEAAKNGDYQTIQMWSSHWSSGHGSQAAGRVDPGMQKGWKQDQMARLNDISCGTEHVAGTHAIVEASNKDDKYFIPFVQDGKQWKFDVRTFSSFYRN